MKDLPTEVTELLAMAIAIVILLVLANRLYAIGVFEATPLTRQSIGPLLVAVCPVREATPGLHDLMMRLSSAARYKGVQEDRSLLGDPVSSITRGEFIGVYHGQVRPFMRAQPAELGIVLDTGENRLTEKRVSAWQKRIARLNTGIREASIRIINVEDALCVPTKWEARASELVGQWRGYRKLLKNWKKLPANERKGVPNMIIEAMSKRRTRVLAVLPVDCTRPVYVS